jgi:RNA polymerase sigma factor (sigma-70 family)
MTDRQSLILEYWPLAKGVAYNICSVSNLKEECQSIATEAMIRAIDNYDPSNGATLKTWIINNVKGHVANFIQSEINDDNIPIDDCLDCSELSTNGLDERINARDLLFKILYYVKRHKKGRTRKDECETLMAYYFDGQLQKEIAEWRGCTQENVSNIICKLKSLIVDGFLSEIN